MNDDKEFDTINIVLIVLNFMFIVAACAITILCDIK